MAYQSSANNPLPSQSLGQVLLDSKLITAEQLRRAQEMENASGKRLGSILIDNGWVNSESLAMALSLHLSLPLIDLKRHLVQAEALQSIPEDIARKRHLVPLDIVDGALAVVMEDPTDIEAIEELTARSGRRVLPLVGVRADIHSAIDLNYRARDEIEKEIAEFAPSVDYALPEEMALVSDEIDQDPVVRSVDLMLEQAYRDRASDIHISPDRDGVKVRFRIDGAMREILSLPKGSHLPLLSRIKVLADINIAERRRPQDGQFARTFDDEEVFFRVATSDTTWGEMVVLRLLGRSDTILDLPGLGFLPAPLTSFNSMIRAPFGMVLVCGPTGSGKTTTLYAALNQLDRDELHILTIEDPVEYNFPGINQIQVNRAAGIIFASGLRGIMRLDPDVIMVGEIRDSETANTAVQAALTGHTVLSSIHANDAPGALIRLADLGVERYLLVSSVVGIVAQRLVRQICPHCRIDKEPTLQERAAYRDEMGQELVSCYIGEGCNFCGQTGYLGRTGVFEVLTVGDSIRELLLRSASASEMKAEAARRGMIPMRRDGMMKVKQGVTTPSEVMKNVYTLG